MTTSHKRKRVISVGHKSHDELAEVPPMNIEQEVSSPPKTDLATSSLKERLERLIELRETQPEKDLKQYMQFAKKEQSERLVVCDEYKAIIAKLQGEIKLLRESVAMYTARDAEHQRLGKPINSGQEQEPEPRKKPRRGKSPGKRKSSLFEHPALECAAPITAEASKLKILELFSGVSMGQAINDEEGHPCFEFAISNPDSDKCVKFTVGHTDGKVDGNELTYRPVEIKPASGEASFSEALDFNVSCSPVLYREILGHVFEKDARKALSIAKKRKSIA